MAATAAASNDGSLKTGFAHDAIVVRKLSAEPIRNCRGSIDAGRGIFAARKLVPFELLHVAPCIRMPRVEYDAHGRHTVLEEYLFNAPDGSRLLALGLGSLFNHSRQPNVDYRIGSSEENAICFYVGHRAIEPGEELCIYYGPDEHLWFPVPKDDTTFTLAENNGDEDEDDENGDHFLAKLAEAALDDEENSADAT